MTTPDRIPFLDLRPAADATDVRAAIDRVLARGWFVLGPEVDAFEQEFAHASGAAHAVGVASGTDAISLLLRAAGIGPGDEVIIPAMTAAFTGLAVLATGAVPRIVDVEPATLTLDAAAAAAAMTPRTRAIVPVHLYGQAADLRAIRRVADRYGVAIIEDCCQAHLATCEGEPVGTTTSGGAFSFYPTKNLGAIGDAGAVVTNDPAVAARVRRLRNGGQGERYRHLEPGINSRLDELQAAVLRARLPRLAERTDRRRVLSERYRHLLPSGLALPVVREYHVQHLFPIRSPRRDALQTHLHAAGIETLVHYPFPLPAQPAFAASAAVETPVAAGAAADLLSLPLHPELDTAAVDRVAEAVRSFEHLAR